MDNLEKETEIPQKIKGFCRSARIEGKGKVEAIFTYIGKIEGIENVEKELLHLYICSNCGTTISLKSIYEEISKFYENK